MIVLEEPTQALPTVHRAIGSLTVVGKRHEDHISLAVMGTFMVIVGDILLQRVSEGLTEQVEAPSADTGTGVTTTADPAPSGIKRAPTKELP